MKVHKRLVNVLVILVLGVLLSACGGSKADGPGAAGMVEKLDDITKAIIQIEAQGTFVDPEFGVQENAAGTGSGFIIDPSGLAVTNNHVVTGAALLKVRLAGEDELRNARIVAVSECSDLAVIDIEGDGFSEGVHHTVVGHALVLAISTYRGNATNSELFHGQQRRVAQLGVET